MYTYHFVAEVHGVSVEASMSFASVSPLVRNTTMKQQAPNELLIEVVKTRTWPESVALEEATLEVEELLDRLALIDNHRVVSFRYQGYVDDAGNFHEPPKRGRSNATLTGALNDPVAYYSLERQKRILTGRLNPGLTRLHRTAQGMPNGVGKFLLLYGAIQVMQGEIQAKVDEHLLSVRPDLLMVHGKHRSETIISHLRNLIAHPSHDIDIQTLTRQAETYCPMLSELVRNELIRTIPP